MGWSLSWVAVKDCTPELVHEVLGLRATGVRMEFADSSITGAVLPSGWYAVISDHDRLELGSDRNLASLSILGEVIICWVEEHCNCSYAAGWRNGAQMWSVCHNAQKSLEHLDSEGDLPKEFARIRDECWGQLVTEGGDCLFSVPVDLAYSLTGYRHDDDVPDTANDAFEVLEVTPASREVTDPIPWYQRLC
jgi:hypothetical protein